MISESDSINNELNQLEAEPSQQPDNVLRRSERTKKQPKHLDSYVTELPTSIDHSLTTSNHGTSEVYPLSHYVSYDKFSNVHKAFLAAITSLDEPKYFHQAIKDVKWREAMKKKV